MPTATVTVQATSTATPEPTSTATPGPGGKLFGPFNWPVDDTWPFTVTRLGRDLSQYEDAYQRGVAVLAAITGGHSGYTDSDGCFSLEMYKGVVDRQNLAAFQGYVDNGTIVAFHAMDEPHDFGECGPTFEDLNEICKYIHLQLPGAKCLFNAPPAWLAQGQDVLTDLDLLFTQTNFQRTEDWVAWAEQQFEDAAWFSGDMWLSVNGYTGGPTAQQIRDAVIDLCRSDAVAVMIWKYGLPDFETLPGMRAAMEEAAGVCAGEGPPATPTAEATATGTPAATATATVVATMTSTPGPGGAIIVDHNSVDADVIPQEWLDQARELVTFFNHKSIGDNILEGIGDLEARDPGRYEISVQFSSGVGSGINHYQSGSNGEPLSKVYGFSDLVKAGHDVAMMKFCAGDVSCVNGDVPIEMVWTEYRATMVGLEQGYPGVRLVWWTMPIIASDHSRAYCNEEMAWFNDQVRAHVGEFGGVLFDIADIEAHDPDGEPVTWNGIEAGWPGWTSDGAHLNEAGRQRVAGGVWWLLARVAGWDGRMD